MTTGEFSSKDSLIGRKLGHYTLTRLLATGGMARIYEAEDGSLGRLVAVKVLEPEKIANDETLMQRFEREAKTIAALEHDNIITIYHFGQHAGIYYIAMKLIKGKDLAQEFARWRRVGERIPVERAIKILWQVAGALDYAHLHDVIHRDIKPSNILIDGNDKAILTDFGLVLKQSIDQTLGTAFGTPRYMAPEQALASSKAVPQSDLYSFAVIVYEALTGQTPFTGDNPMEIALSHVSDIPPSPRSINPDIPYDAERELMRALEKDPDKRQLSVSDLVQGVAEAYGITLDPTASRPATNPYRPTNTTQAERPATMPLPPSPWDDWNNPPPALPSVPRVGGAKAYDDEPKPSNRIPLIAGAAVVALVILIGLFAALSNSNSSGTVTATPRPNPGATDPASIGGPPPEAEVQLVYTDFGFVIENPSDLTLDLAPLVLVRGDVGGDDDFTGDRITRAELPAGNCARVQLQNRQVALDAECPRDPHAVVLQTDPTRFFWRREPIDAATFEVRYRDAVIATCNTVARGDSDTCVFEWPEDGFKE